MLFFVDQDIYFQVRIIFPFIAVPDSIGNNVIEHHQQAAWIRVKRMVNIDLSDTSYLFSTVHVLQGPDGFFKQFVKINFLHQQIRSRIL